MIHCFVEGCRFNDTQTDTCRKSDILIEDSRCASYEGAAGTRTAPERDTEKGRGGNGM